MEENYLSEHWLFNKSDNKKQPTKWVRKDYRGNEQVWYSEDEVEILKKNANVFQKYITQNEQLKMQIDCLVKKNEKLKALCDTYRTCYQAKHSDIKGMLFKYRTTLQEIKAIVCSNCEIIDTQGRKDILKLITKAEEE